MNQEKHQEWLDKRSQGIGGSEVATLLNLNPYKTPFQLWLDKTGRSEPFTGNEFTRRGQHLEQAVVNFYVEREQPKEITETPEGEVIIHKDFDFARATPDRLVTLQDGTEVVLECKTTMKHFEESLEGIPKTWLCQVQWYMGITDRKFGHIAWLESDFRFKLVKVEFNKELFELMLKKAQDFWLNNVLKDVEPELTTASDVEIKFPDHTKDKTVIAKDSLHNTVIELQKTKAELRLLEERKTDLEETIKMVMQDSEYLKHTDEGVLATWKTQSGRKSFDQKSFKEEHPDMFDKYIKQGKSFRVFRIK